MRVCRPVAVVVVVLLVAAACAADEQQDPQPAIDEVSEPVVEEAADGGVVAEPALLVLGELPDTAMVAASAREILVSWPEAEPVAGSAVAGYEVQWRSGGQGWDIERRRVVIGLSYAIRGLDNGVSYTVRVRPAAVEVAEVQGASIIAGEGSAPTAEVVEDPPPLNPIVHQSVLPLEGAVNFEMTGEAVWPATIILPVDLDLVGDDDFVELVFYNESLDLWVPSPGAVLDRERGVITAEVYHLSLGDAGMCLLSLWLCKPVTDAVGTGVQALQQHVERVSRLLSQNWDEAAGWLREGWSTAGEFVFGDLPELARQVLDRAGARLQPWARAWLEAVSEVAQLHIERFKTMTIKRLGYGISPPSCPGGGPDWAAPSRLVPDKDIVLHCDDTAAARGDGRDDLLLKLTANRTYGLTVRPGDERTNIGYPYSDNISVEQMDIASDLEDLLSGSAISLATDKIVIPPGGTASLRIPLSSLRNQTERGDQTKSSAELIYGADALSLVLQALLLAVDLAGGRTSQLVSGFKCAVAGVAGSANAYQSDDHRALIDVAVGVFDDCLLPVIPAAGNLMLAIGGIVLLHETQRMIADGAFSDDHRIIAESEWTVPPDAAASGISAGGVHTCAIRSGGTIECWGDPGDGRTNPPTGTYFTVTAGQYHSCAIRSDDSTAVCWGSQGRGGADAPSGTFKDIAAGHLHSCGLRSNGTIICWGDDFYGQAEAPTGTPTFKAVTAGQYHSCAIRSDDTIECWGRDSYNETDAPSGTASSTGGCD